MSVLPAKILKILEWVGFRGDKEGGLRLLYETVESQTCRSLFAKWVPMFYHYWIQYFMGTVGEKEGNPYCLGSNPINNKLFSRFTDPRHGCSSENGFGNVSRRRRY